MAKALRDRLFYGWVIVAVSFLTVFLALGTRFSFGVFYVAILDEYGWSRAETAGAFSLAMIFHAIFAPISGYLLDRFGPRRLFPLGAVVMAAGLFAASRTNSMAELYLYFGVLISIGVNTLSYTPHMALISNWFKRRRGLACGLVLAGIGTGMGGLAPLVQLIIDGFGWRQAFLVLSIVTLLVIIPLTAIFQRRSPAEVGQHVDGIEPPPPQPAPGPGRIGAKSRGSGPGLGWTMGKALRSRDFWLLFLSPLANGFTMNMMAVHQAAFIVDAGHSPLLAASLVGAVGLLGSLGGIMGGLISDRIGREMSYGLCCLGANLGVGLLLLTGRVSSSWPLWAFVLLYGLAQGALSPITAARSGDLFGGASIGRIMGLLAVGFGLGGALGAFGGGFLFDLTGSYTAAFLLLILFQGVGGLGMWLAGRRAG